MAVRPSLKLEFVLGMAQMFGAVVALVLLVTTGLSRTAIVIAALTTACTAWSRLLIQRR